MVHKGRIQKNISHPLKIFSAPQAVDQPVRPPIYLPDYWVVSDFTDDPTCPYLPFNDRPTTVAVRETGAEAVVWACDIVTRPLGVDGRLVIEWTLSHGYPVWGLLRCYVQVRLIFAYVPYYDAPFREIGATPDSNRAFFYGGAIPHAPWWSAVGNPLVTGPGAVRALGAGWDAPPPRPPY